MEEHFSKIMKTHNTLCIKMGAWVLTFGEIKAIIITEEKKILLCIYECKTLGYCQHFHSWVIQKTSRKKILYCSNEITRQLLYPRVASVETFFVTLKYAA